jgi:hypothetical protein
MDIRWTPVAYVEVEANSNRVATGKPLEMYVCMYVWRCRLLLKEIVTYLHGETVTDRQRYGCEQITRRDKQSSLLIMPAVSGWVSTSHPLLPGKRLLQFRAFSFTPHSD